MDSTAIIVIAAVAVLIAAVLVAWVVRRRSRGPAAGPAPEAAPPPTLRARLASSRKGLGDRLQAVFAREAVDDATWEQIGEALLAADVGVATTDALVEAVRRRRPDTGSEARVMLEQELIALLGRDDRELRLTSDPAVVLVIGVNGTGKTTSIAKLAALVAATGRRPVLAAADTFRAAAEEQLRAWGERIGAEVVSAESGSDPAAVAFDAVRRARHEPGAVVIVDTAGRLHSKANLMDELGKIARVLRREAGAIDEVLLVLDATTGQNAAAQAKAFTDAVGVTGLVLTKLDGTGRGGVVVAIERDLDVPVKLIGVGEGAADLLPFDPSAFVEALMEP